jgi:hypothetical protein
MSEIVFASVFVAELRKISVTPDSEKNWRILEILDGLESRYRK